MKTLLILRHAKSSWNKPGLEDHERPLNPRGKRDAPRMGRLLTQLGLVPDLIVSSTARRAARTAAAVAEADGFAGALHLTGALYLADPATYIEQLRLLGAGPPTVMVVGHNPGAEELFELLAGRHETLPTAALAAIRLPIESWSDLTPDLRGEPVGVWRPKELPAEG